MPRFFALRRWWARRLLRKWCRPNPDVVPSRALLFEELFTVYNPEQVTLAPYEGLASIWDSYSPCPPDYAGYLRVAAPLYGRVPEKILELCCGTGTLTTKLGTLAQDVVGIDISKAMLDRARTRCAANPAIRLVQGDIRTLQFSQQFDVAVCAGNSLNYVEPGGLNRVLKGVAGALRPGGLFLFDTVTRSNMRRSSDYYLHMLAANPRFAILFSFDQDTDVGTATVLMPQGRVEVHRRSPIDPEDVVAASRMTGFEILDSFSYAVNRKAPPDFCFFVLRKTASD